MSPIPMITRVRLRNYRSIAACDVTLGPLTILVGPNGSGKSNLLRALRLVAEALDNGLDSAIRADGGMRSTLPRWTADDPDARLSIELDLSLADERRGTYLLELARTGLGGYAITREVGTVTEPGTAKEAARFVNDSDGYRLIGADASSPSIQTANGARTRPMMLVHMDGHPVVGSLCEALRGMSFYSLHVAAMRKLQEPDAGERLAANGANLASVLQRMVDENERGWSPLEPITGTLAAITPGIEAIEVPTVEGYPVLRVRQHLAEGGPAYTFGAGELSYGTLRTLGVLTALYQGSMKGGSPVTLVGIEEPESAVHPAIAVALLEAMDEASLTTQVLATTHSPSMLDQKGLDVSILRAVSLEGGRTTIGPVDAVSRDMIERRLYTVPELLDMGQLQPDVQRGELASDAVATPAR